jgi:acetyltransferase-like isoleucine patch superfamily enzyme
MSTPVKLNTKNLKVLELLKRLSLEGARRLLVATLVLLFPLVLVRTFLNALGCRVSSDAKVGFSWLFCRRLELQGGSRVGHFNYFCVNRLSLGSSAKIGDLNIARGPFDIVLLDRAGIGNRNTFARAPLGVTYGHAQIQLGRDSKITAGHTIDCTATILFGDNSILAGKGSQVWTHGYVHRLNAGARYRVDGEVRIGDNVYLGSRVIITSGVVVLSGVIVGAGVILSKELNAVGMYVSAPLRMLARPSPPGSRSDLNRIECPELAEEVYRKNSANKSR